LNFSIELGLESLHSFVNGYRPETYRKRIEIFAGATEFCGSQAVLALTASK
jgi:hypothetical protein